MFSDVLLIRLVLEMSWCPNNELFQVLKGDHYRDLMYLGFPVGQASQSTDKVEEKGMLMWFLVMCLLF